MGGAFQQCGHSVGIRTGNGSLVALRNPLYRLHPKHSCGGATWAEAKAVARGLHGGFAIVKGLGYRLYPSAKSMMYSVPNFLNAFLLWVLSRIPTMRELL